MKDIGKLWNKKRWFSFCSKHAEYDKNCLICQGGTWTNVWKHNIEKVIYKISPRFWMWWVN